MPGAWVDCGESNNRYAIAAFRFFWEWVMEDPFSFFLLLGSSLNGRELVEEEGVGVVRFSLSLC